jgi:hypothetical protein
VDCYLMHGEVLIKHICNWIQSAIFNHFWNLSWVIIAESGKLLNKHIF